MKIKVIKAIYRYVQRKAEVTTFTRMQELVCNTSEKNNQVLFFIHIKITPSL